MAHYVTAFYKFMNLSDPAHRLSDLKSQIEKKAESLQIKGLIILGPEGINSTCSALSSETLEEYKKFILELFQQSEMNFKDSLSEKPPFRRLAVKIRDEIVTTGNLDLSPQQEKNQHLNPSQWNQVLQREEDYVLVDTRNWYEYKVGTFTGAINPDIDKFSDFPAYLEEQKISKEKKMLIFCTGGIRCEKGILELQKQGYQNVYQLEGGVLKYLEEYPEDQFQGECFVFDHRVALDQNLKPSSKYGLCPHCGQPSALQIECKRCDSSMKICEECAELDWKKDTCSKNCAYHYELHPERKVRAQKITAPQQ